MQKSKNKILNCNIIEFFEEEWLLNIKNLSPIQKMTLKVIRAEPLDDKTPIEITHPYQNIQFANEVEMFKYFSGKSEYVCKHYSEASLLYGRRSGKSSTIAAGLSIYYATQFDYTPYLGTSPHATIPIISASKEQAGEVYIAIKNMFLKSPYLFQEFLEGKIDSFQEEYSEDDLKNKSSITGGKIKLNNKVVIKVMTADVSTLRGMAVPMAIMDENCFYGADGNDIKNTDRSIFEALTPSLAQFHQVEGMALVLKISTPNGQAGLMYSDYENRIDPDVLHLQVPTWYANPTISVSYLEKQKKKGTSFFSREYGAEYTASESSYLDPNLIDASIIRGVEDIEPDKEHRYVAAMDYAARDDLWGFAIGHKEYFIDPITKVRRERVQIDFIRSWRGRSGEDLNPDVVLSEISNYMKKYRVSYCLTDQYAYAALRSLAQKYGILLKEFTVTHQSKLKFLYSLQISINSDSFRIVHNPIAIKHLKDLREKRSPSGQIKVEHAASCKDDLAMAIALTVYQFDKSSPVYIGHTFEETEVKIDNNIDALGRYTSTPTAEQLAQFTGNRLFFDNQKEYEERKKEEAAGTEEEDPDGFWFSI